MLILKEREDKALSVLATLGSIALVLLIIILIMVGVFTAGILVAILGAALSDRKDKKNEEQDK